MNRDFIVMILLPMILGGCIQSADVGGDDPSREGKLASSLLGDNEIYKKVDSYPLFGECVLLACSNKELGGFIPQHIMYPEEAKKKGVEGKVYVRFIVEKDGTVGEISILKDLGFGTGASAVDVMNKMNESGPMWTPGQLNGQDKRVSMVLPFTFSLEG